MSIPTNKVQLIAAIEASYYKLKADLETIPIELSTQKELVGHAKASN